MDLSHVKQGDILGVSDARGDVPDRIISVLIVESVDGAAIRGNVLNGQYEVSFDRMTGLSTDDAAPACRVAYAGELPQATVFALNALNAELSSIAGLDAKKAAFDSRGDALVRDVLREMNEAAHEVPKFGAGG